MTVGYVQGYETGEDVEGDVDGELDGASVVGAARRGPSLRLAPKPGWRRGEVAPGVQRPQAYLHVLPMTADDGSNGVLSVGNPAGFNFIGRPQRPFRGERILASVNPSAPGLGAALCSGIFVGTAVQLVELGTFDVSFFAPTAFGVRLYMSQAQPGVEVRVGIRPQVPLAVGDSIAVSLMVMGQAIG